MLLILAFTGQFYLLLQVLLVDTNKTTLRQGYNIIKDRREKKDRDENLWKLCFKYIESRSYKDNNQSIE